MADIQKLKALSVDDLLKELRARTAKAGKAVLAKAEEPSESLREFDDATVVNILKANQKVIYGTDDRVDVFQLPVGPNLDDVDSVVALFRAQDVVDNGNGTSTLQTVNFRVAQNLCPGERFGDQPATDRRIGCFCSGFLVAPDIIATAGHCVDAGSVTNVRFVFGFRMRDATTAESIVNGGEIYSGVAVIGRQLAGTGADWSLVRMDRPVTNHRIARIRRAGRIGNTQAVHVIGHPSGLPTKFAGGAAVRDNQPNAFFVANLDTYGGNSGSPVFNSDTHEVEGILVRGENDFVQQGNCMVSLVCPNAGCRGEDCTRTTEFAQLIEETGQLLSYGDAGTPGNVSNPVVVGFGGWQDFKFLFSGGNRIYAVDQNGQLLSYGDAGTPGNVSNPVVVGFGGWQDFKFLFSGGNRIYAVDQNGQLLSYGDAGTPGNVSNPVVVGSGGWQDFKFLFSGRNLSGENRIYAVDQNGQLLSYGDAGTPGNVSNPVVVGFGGWQDFKFLFSGGNRIYAVDQNGQLLSYGDAGTPGNVSNPVVVGFGGWQDFKFLFSGGNLSGENRIYAVVA